MHRNFIFSEIQIPPINVPRLLQFEYLVGENKRKNEQREKENSACSSGRFEADFVSLWTRVQHQQPPRDPWEKGADTQSNSFLI